MSGIGWRVDSHCLTVRCPRPDWGLAVRAPLTLSTLEDRSREEQLVVTRMDEVRSDPATAGCYSVLVDAGMGILDGDFAEVFAVEPAEFKTGGWMFV